MSILDYGPILSQQKKSIKPMLPGGLMSIVIKSYEIPHGIMNETMVLMFYASLFLGTRSFIENP
jgi:hypothetical protein